MKYSDQSIKENVIRRISKERNPNFRNVFVDVKNRTVQIRGTVPTYRSRLEVYEKIMDTRGVISVDNRLTVSFNSGTDVPNDDKIKEIAENILNWNADVDVSKVELNVEAGIIAIRGAVSAVWQKMRIEELLSYIKGVIAIKNELTIVPTEKIRDELVADGILNDLRSDAWITVADIDVIVAGGHVKLKGSVPSYKALTRAHELAMNTPGVLSVDNEMKVVDES